MVDSILILYLGRGCSRIFLFVEILSCNAFVLPAMISFFLLILWGALTVETPLNVMISLLLLTVRKCSM